VEQEQAARCLVALTAHARCVVSQFEALQVLYAPDLPCPVKMAVRFGVRLIFVRSLPSTVGKYCFVVAALALVIHSSCHFCLASSAAS